MQLGQAAGQQGSRARSTTSSSSAQPASWPPLLMGRPLPSPLPPSCLQPRKFLAQNEVVLGRLAMAGAAAGCGRRLRLGLGAAAAGAAEKVSGAAGDAELPLRAQLGLCSSPTTGAFPPCPSLSPPPLPPLNPGASPLPCLSWCRAPSSAPQPLPAPACWSGCGAARRRWPTWASSSPAPPSPLPPGKPLPYS